MELWANFEEQPVTPQALDSTVKLLAWLRERHGLREISTHRSQASGQTQCPGRNFMRDFDLGELQKRVDEKVLQGLP